MFNPRYLEIAKASETAYPNFFKQIYSRRIIPPNHLYGNPRLYATSLTSIAATSAFSGFHARNHVVGGIDLCVQEIIKQKCPAFFVHPEFLEAVANTDLSEDFELKTIKWPLDAMTFYLPVDLSKKLFGVPVPWISIARIGAGKHRIGGEGHFVDLKEDRVAFHYPVFAALELPSDFGGVYPISGKLNDFLRSTPFFTDVVAFKSVDKLTEEQDQQISDKGTKLAILLVMAMVARPEYVEMGKVIRPGKKNPNNPKKEQDELWSANVIGKGYASKREEIRNAPTGIAPGRSPRIHIRRGHFRNQVKGALYDIGGNIIPAQQRPHSVIWIEPVWVG